MNLFHRTRRIASAARRALSTAVETALGNPLPTPGDIREYLNEIEAEHDVLEAKINHEEVVEEPTDTTRTTTSNPTVTLTAESHEEPDEDEILRRRVQSFRDKSATCFDNTGKIYKDRLEKLRTMFEQAFAIEGLRPLLLADSFIKLRYEKLREHDQTVRSIKKAKQKAHEEHVQKRIASHSGRLELTATNMRTIFMADRPLRDGETQEIFDLWNHKQLGFARNLRAIWATDIVIKHIVNKDDADMTLQRAFIMDRECMFLLGACEAQLDADSEWIRFTVDFDRQVNKHWCEGWDFGQLPETPSKIRQEQACERTYTNMYNTLYGAGEERKKKAYLKRTTELERAMNAQEIYYQYISDNKLNVNDCLENTFTDSSSRRKLIDELEEIIKRRGEKPTVKKTGGKKRNRKAERRERDKAERLARKSTKGSDGKRN